MNIKETILYCGKHKDTYEDFSPHPLGVQLFGVNKEDIVKVKVKEALEGEEHTHYAWWNNKKNVFEFIFKNKLQIETCFHYGSKVQVDLGHGKIYGIVVNEIVD